MAFAGPDTGTGRICAIGLATGMTRLEVRKNWTRHLASQADSRPIETPFGEALRCIRMVSGSCASFIELEYQPSTSEEPMEP
jgi:hypothetical protein